MYMLKPACYRRKRSWTAWALGFKINL